jgi:anaerobic selenocysteine-containing dehydrogenase
MGAGTTSSTEERPSFCRVCNHYCPIMVTVADGRVVRVAGDRSNDVWAGYTCVKGRALPAMLSSPRRLLHSLKRVDGELVPIESERAMDEIAEQLQRLLDRYGPRSVAHYLGTFITANVATLPLIDSFMEAIGSPMYFTPIPIDKPGKQIAQAMHGTWMAPGQGFSDPKVALLIGVNPFVSYMGFPYGHPGKWLADAQSRGLRLIVVDPRVTDVAKRADLHLWPRPGHDVAILAAMLRVILDEGLEDRRFLTENASGLDTLGRAVHPFAPVEVARRAGIDVDDLVRAARMFATERGYAFSGTGPSMTGFGSLVEYLALCLETVSGHWLRAGDVVGNARTVMPPLRPIAQAAPPTPAYGFGEQMRVRGLGNSAAGMPTAALPDEILLDGEGQVRALISCAGNPVAAFPDQLKTIEAMKKLELLVQIDPWLSATARLAHYVIAPTMSLETPGVTSMYDYGAPLGCGVGPAVSTGQYTPALVEPPAGSDVIDEYAFYFGLARRMGLPLSVGGQMFTAIEAQPLEMDAPMPTPDQMLELLCRGSRIPLDVVKEHPHGAQFADPPVVVAERTPGWEGRLQLADGDMMRDLAMFESSWPDDAHVSGLRLICRRLTHVRNSSCNDPATNHGRGYNPAFVHPDDLDALGLVPGDVVRIASDRAAIVGIVQADDTLLRGVVSMAHAYGDGPDRDAEFREIGSSTSRLLFDDVGVERYTGQPRMSNVPVTIVRWEGGLTSAG